MKLHLEASPGASPESTAAAAQRFARAIGELLAEELFRQAQRAELVDLRQPDLNPEHVHPTRQTDEGPEGAPPDHADL